MNHRKTLCLALVGVVFLVGCLGEKTPPEKNVLMEDSTHFNISRVMDSLENQSTIKVNNEKITVEEVDAAYEEIPGGLRDTVSREDVLVSLVNEKLLLQEAERQDIPFVDGEDVRSKQAVIAELLARNVALYDAKLSEEEIDEMIDAEFDLDVLKDDPELAAILHDQTEARLKAKKQVELVQDYLEELRNNATIE